MTNPTDLAGIDFEADATPQEPTGLEGLGTVSALGIEACDLEDEIALLEKQLGAKKARLTAILEKELPDTMFSLQLEKVGLANKREVKITDFVRGSIPKERAGEACKWLRDHGHAGLIRQTVALSFGPGEDQKAKEVAEALAKKGYTVASEATVHHSTLASWAREMKKNGKDFPADLLGLYIGRKATIK